MLFDSFDSSFSFGNLQKYLKIYCEDKLHSFLPVRVVFSLKTRSRWKLHLFTSQLNLPKFGKRHLFFLNHVGNLRKGLLTFTYNLLNFSKYLPCQFFFNFNTFAITTLVNMFKTLIVLE